MQRLAARRVFHAAVAVSFLAAIGSSQALWAQQSPAPAPALPTPDQLDNLVAPVALYPDPLLSEVLAASTYPLEIVDADQWLQQNRNLPAAQRMDAAKQQNWDPSVQALVAFPDVLDILGRDIRWTTDLGNAFLAQQADVMNAIQSMRARARQSGQLQTTPQQTVTTETQAGQSAVQIAPADPTMIYPPVYDPYAVWGPPVYGAYPSLWYPPAWGGFGVGIGFAPGIFIGGLFAGLLSFGGWGWGLSWLAHALFLNPLFFAHFGFHGFGGGYGGSLGGYHGAMVAGHPVWAHDPVHRMGVPYSNREVASRFGGRFGGGSASPARSLARPEGARAEGARAEAARPQSGGAWRGVGSSGARTTSASQFATRATPQTFGGANRGGGNYSRVGPAETRQSRSFAAPRGQTPSRGQQQARQPRNMARSYSAPRRASSSPRASASPSHGGSSHAPASHGGGHSSGHRG